MPESSAKTNHPPVFVATQFGTEASICSALRQALADVEDPKHRVALAAWSAAYLEGAWKTDTERTVHEKSLRKYAKFVIDGLAHKSQEKSLKCFQHETEKMTRA